MNTARYNRRPAAFSLLETMLAASLLAGAVLTIGTLSGRSLSAIRIDRETERAWELADMQLTLIDAFGVSSFLDANITGGQFQNAPEYSWQIEISTTDLEGLYAIRLEVFWESGGSAVARRIACETRLCSESSALNTGSSTGGSEPQ